MERDQEFTFTQQSSFGPPTTVTVWFIEPDERRNHIAIVHNGANRLFIPFKDLKEVER